MLENRTNERGQWHQITSATVRKHSKHRSFKNIQMKRQKHFNEKKTIRYLDENQKIPLRLWKIHTMLLHCFKLSSIPLFSYYHLCSAVELIYICLNNGEPKIIYLWLRGWEKKQVLDIKTVIIPSAVLNVLSNLWTSFPIGENVHYILFWAVADTIFCLQDLKKKGLDRNSP